MKIVRTRDELFAARAALTGTVAFVPTMGALHDGHLALTAAARGACDWVVASVFVNPTQFSDANSASGYPRDEAGDMGKLESAGCDLAFVPDVSAIYPDGDATVIEPSGPALDWEGRFRPGHFRGMATVVAKLFGLVRPDVACFGEKDWQQLQVVRRMVADLLLPVRVQGVPTVREPDGLAMSSRNRFLSPAERAIAPLLYATLREGARQLRGGADASGVLEAAIGRLKECGFAVDYLALVEGTTLRATTALDGARLIAATPLGPIRLLDNIGV
jgi:pantoate--beta-alanine ligase